MAITPSGYLMFPMFLCKLKIEVKYIAIGHIRREKSELQEFCKTAKFPQLTELFIPAYSIKYFFGARYILARSGFNLTVAALQPDVAIWYQGALRPFVQC